MKILQINIDRGGAALDLVFKVMKDEYYDICLISEPTKSQTEEWFGHEDAKMFVAN